MKYLNLNSVMEEIKDEILVLYREQLASRGINATGNLSKNASTKVDVTDIGSKHFEDIIFEVPNEYLYYYFVEFGRGPSKNKGKKGDSLLGKIMNWMVVKNISAPSLPIPTILKSFGKKGAKIRKTFNQQDRDFTSLAFAITRHIHQHGTKGYRNPPEVLNTILENNYNKWERMIIEGFNKDIMGELERELKSKFNKIERI